MDDQKGNIVVFVYLLIVQYVFLIWQKNIWL